MQEAIDNKKIKIKEINLYFMQVLNDIQLKVNLIQ